MSRKFRHGAVGIGLTTLLSGVLLAGSETAYADRGESGEQVVFAGQGILDVACAADPSVRSLRVPAESTVRVVNSTGRAADLLLDGRSQGGIPENGSTRVIFRRGTVAMSVAPACLLATESARVLVTTTPAAAPIAVGSTATPAASGRATTPSGSASPTASATAGPRSPSATPTPSSTRATPTGSPEPSRGSRRPVPPVRDAAEPRASARGSGAETAQPRPEPTRTAQATRSRPPDGGARRSADADPAAGSTSKPRDSGVGNAVPHRGASPDVVAGSRSPAAESVVALRPLPGTGPVGLLAMIATVCVLGVLVGLIRAIASHRASRSKVA